MTIDEFWYSFPPNPFRFFWGIFCVFLNNPLTKSLSPYMTEGVSCSYMRDYVLAPVYWTCLWDSFGVPVYGTLAIPYAILHVRAPNRATCLWSCSWYLFGGLGWGPVYGTWDFHGGLDSGPGNRFPKRAPYHSLSGYPIIAKKGRGISPTIVARICQAF